MTEKRFAIKDSSLVEGAKVIVDNKGKYTFPITKDESTLVVYEKILVKQDMMIESQEKQLQKQHRVIEEQDKRIVELEKDVEYWKQVASQYINELNVFEHCKKYKTECKDIYWDSD